MKPKLGWGVLLLTLIVGPAAADTFPSKPIRLVVPAPAGGGADILARTLGAGLTRELGVAVVVDNRSGAGGNIAADLVAKAPPDGYTIFLGDSGQLAINSSLYRTLTYDPQRDFTPISLVASFPVLLLAHPGFAPNSAKELVAAAKAAPGSISYASTGIGTPQHLAGEMLSKMAGIRMMHVPYRGGAPALADLLAGQVQIAFIGVPPTIGHVKSGRLKALAITSARRSELLPDIPSVAEAGYPDYEALVWFGLVGPAHLPADAAAKLAGAASTVLRDPATRSQLRAQGYDAIAGPPDRLASHIKSETAKWRELVYSSGASVD